MRAKPPASLRWPFAALTVLMAAGVTLAAGAVGEVGAAASAAASPIFGVTIPGGYRQWELVAVSYETAFDEFRGILGNPAALKAYQDGTLPFPDGAMLAKIAWKRVPSAEFAGAFISGTPSTVQFMVKDSRKYAATGGWGFGRFIRGEPVDEAQHRTCFPCHQASVKSHDFVFTRFAP